MKILRPGNTEIHLIISYFCEKYCTNLTPDEKNKIECYRKTYIDWLYKTGGYYNKDIPIKDKYTYPDDYDSKFQLYISKMAECLENSDMICGLKFLKLVPSILAKYIPDVEIQYNTKCVDYSINAREIIPYIINKKVLVISPFKELIDSQIIDGNLKKIQPILNNSSFIIYKFPYTFLNNGPDNDSFETLERIKNDIKINYTDFDIAILSCGSYGSFLVNFIADEIKKDAIYVGGQLPLIFGIIGNRDKWAIKELYNNDTSYLINGVPENYRPEGWQKIEDGCYW